MSCPIVLANITSPSASITISELSELTLAGGSSSRIDELFSLEVISNSAELQGLIDSGDVTLTYGPDLISDLSDLCFTPSEFQSLNKLSWSWSAGRKGKIKVSAIDLVSLDGSGTNDLPILSASNCEILKVVTKAVGELLTTTWKFQILKSSDAGATWTVEREETVNSGVATLDYLSTNNEIAVNAGDALRVKFVKTNGFVLNPEVYMLVKEV